MTQAQMMDMAIAGAILFAAYKYGTAEVKTGAVAIAATIIARKIPYVKDQIA